MKPNIILLFDINDLYSTQSSYWSKILQYTKELIWYGQEIDYNAVINAYTMALSVAAILTANPKDRHSGSAELSVIATYKAASKILIVLVWNSYNEYNEKIERNLRSKLYRAGAPENFIVSFYSKTQKEIINACLEMFGWSDETTSLIEFQNGSKMQIPAEVILFSETDTII